MTAQLSAEALETKALALAQEVQANDADVRIEYVIHHQGHLKSNLHMMEDRFLDHPAGRLAIQIVRRDHPPHEPSQFHGLCVKKGYAMMGLQSSTFYLGIINLNINSQPDFFFASCDLYRLTWQALELVTQLKSHQLEIITDRPMMPKRHPLAEARINLRADLFAALFAHSEGYENALDLLSGRRAMNILSRVLHDEPALYPLPLITEATRYALTEIIPHLSKHKTRLERLTELVFELSETITDDQLKLWGHMCGLTQDMAWRGYRPETITAAAIHTSDDPFLRSMMHTVADLAQVIPQDAETVQKIYNAFIGLEGNHRLHHNMADQAFESCLEKATHTGDEEPFFALADQQNQDLLQGRFLGWCASALQAAGASYRDSQQLSIQPRQVARVEFEGQSHLPPLPALARFTTFINQERHRGATPTFPLLVDWARARPEMELLARSIELTLTRQQGPTKMHTPTPNPDEMEWKDTAHSPGLNIGAWNRPAPHHSQPISPAIYTPAAAPPGDNDLANTPTPFSLEDD